MTMMLVVLLAAVAAFWMYALAKPAPAKVRRNLLQEELLSSYSKRIDV